MTKGIIIVAGATGNLGERIVKAIIEKKTQVRALIRRGTPQEKIQHLQNLGSSTVEIDFANVDEVAKACSGGSCVVSALSGLRPVIIDAQSTLLDGAVKAGVPRFIPSDYSMDFTKLPEGSNRNLDLRREFHRRLDQAPIKATTIFNGAFTDMLTGQAPFILFKFKRVLYWQNADQLMDFTTMDNTAAFTAAAALDSSTPRFLRIAGDQISARDLSQIVSEIKGQNFRLFRAGSLRTFGLLIRFVRAITPDKGEIYPPWQGMQYMHNMYGGLPKLEPLDNARYPDMTWTSAKEVLAENK